MSIELYKPNELIATFSQLKLSRSARHLGNYFLEHAQKKIKFENYQDREFQIDIKELNSIAGIDIKNHRFISKITEELMNSVVTIRPQDDPRNFIKICMIYLAIADFEKGIYKFRLAEEVYTLLKEQRYFTKFELLEMNPLKSKHSLIIYEWLKRYEYSPQIPVMTVDELRKITDTFEKKAYNNFSNLQKYVLDVAVNEINTTTKYRCSYEAIKKRATTRTKVSEIRWTFKEVQITDIPAEQQLKHYNQYEDLLKSYQITFVELTIEDVYKADCQYTFDTLALFAEQIEKHQYSHKTNDKFHKWLEERTQEYKGYYYRESKIKDCYNCLQSLTRKNNTTKSNEITGTTDQFLPMSLLPPDLLKKDNEPDNNFVIEAKKQYGKFCYRDYIKYMYDLYEKNKGAGTPNLIEPFLLKENY